MKLIDNISIDAIKANQDAYLNESVSSLLDEKTSAFEASGLESLISGPDSIFNTIKRLIGKFQTDFTNSINIVEENKEQYFSKIDGFDELPEDLK